MKNLLKKSLAVIIATFVMLTAAPFIGLGEVKLDASAYDDVEYTSGYYTYIIENGEVTITNCDSSITGDVVVPTILDGYPVIAISGGAFANCTEMTSIHLPAQLGEDFWYYGATAPFNSCTNLETITVAEDNTEYYTDENGVLFNREFKALIQYPIANKNTSYTIPDDITYICRSAFADNAYLKNITFPDSVLRIRNNAFENCASLETVVLGSGINEIERYTFENCKKLKEINIPFGVNSIASDAFSNCECLTKIVLPESISIIEARAFDSCTTLSDITLPDKIISIALSSFSNTMYFNNEDNWSDGVLYIGNHLICANLGDVTEYTVKNGTITISILAFYNCTALEDINIPDSVSYIGQMAFDNTALYNNTNNWTDNSLYIDNHLISVNQSSTGKYEIKDGTLTISDAAFLKCNELTSVSIPNTVKSIGNAAFAYCSKLETVNLPTSLEYLGYHAFSECEALNCNLEVPSNIGYIGLWCFNGCSSITELSFAKSNGQYIGLSQAALASMFSIKAFPLSLPEGIINIPKNAFSGSGTEYIILPDSTEYIGASIGGGKFIHIPHTVKVVDSQDFNENMYICSEYDSEYLRDVAKENGVEFKICNGHDDIKPSDPSNPDEPTTPDEPSTGLEENTTIINIPSVTKINFGDTLVLTIDEIDVPEGYTVTWFVEGSGVSTWVSEDGYECHVTSVTNGTATIYAKIINDDGEPLINDEGKEVFDEITIVSKASFWQKLISFFKNLFGINRIIY